ncbi:AAA family ATPase [Actinomyces naeslundii]|uniref:AAA family ATPase n=1 Tax=Actinomyces naeslundii TaxID=1655 RepID=UPI0028D219C9|nr:AAA family ATPase [Actinomyces naeslundii]
MSDTANISDNTTSQASTLSTQAINQDILGWLEKRPIWQRNLFQRVVRNQAIDNSYIEQLVDLLVASKTVAPETPALTIDELPQGGDMKESITICSVGDLQGVNALLGGQTLKFSPTGMTIVYGDNGSGKSGYARLLKQIVGARHHEEILSNVFTNERCAQSAQINYRCGGTDQAATWSRTFNDTTFGRVHFYDEACGNDYLQNETELSYRPSVLGLLDRLVELIDQVSSEIGKRITVEEAKQFSLPNVPDGTSAANFLSELSDRTDPHSLDQLLDAHQDLDKEIQEYRQEEARLRATDPTKEKTRLFAIAKDAEALAAHLESIENTLSPTAADRILTLKQRAMKLRASADEVSSSSFADEPLPGVGSQTWRAMWEAAERYAQAEAYPDRDFPATEDDDVCVLCQQPLAQDAQARLRRFRDYVRNTVQQQAKDAERTYSAAVDQLKKFDVTTPSVLSWLVHFTDNSDLNKNTLAAVLNVAVTAKERILERLQDNTDEGWVELAAVDISIVRSLATAKRDEANVIDLDSFKKSLDSVKKKLQECEGLQKLGVVKEEIVCEIKRRKHVALLTRKKRELSTTQVTKLSKRLATDYVTKTVSDRFLYEANNLKLEHVVLSDPRGSKGAIRQIPALKEVSTASSISTMQVLSEGEQTAAGLAGFLTEVYFDESKSAVIFDDPMSSLDHQRRSNAAARIVELAQDRQVIVFTHDLIFLTELVKHANYADVSILEQTIQRNVTKQPGMILDEFPWKAKDVKKRTGDLREDLARIKKQQDSLSVDAYEIMTSDWAGRLSETWERMIRSEVIYRIVDRSTTEVKPKLVRILAQITDDDYQDFDASYSAVSTWARRHDKSEEFSYVAPDPEEMEYELNRLAEWYARIKGYANNS